MGIRGRMWRYVDALYARSVPVVRVEGQVSQPVEVDLGVAQGDTLSCVFFSLYASDLIIAYEAACADVALTGPPLQAPPGQPGAQHSSPAARASMISALMFADDSLWAWPARLRSCRRAWLRRGIGAASGGCRLTWARQDYCGYALCSCSGAGAAAGRGPGVGG
jgi:hypothetical protein